MADFESMLNAQLTNYKSGFNPGDRVKGVVTNITNQFVILDVNAKREGLVAPADMMNEDGTMRCKVGDTIEVVFAGMKDSAFLFTGSSNSKTVVDRTLAEAFAKQMPIEGKVEKEVKGGYEVTIAGKRGFCPFSQISLFRQEGAVYTGEKFMFLVTEYGDDGRGENIILSQRAAGSCRGNHRHCRREIRRL